MTPYRRRGITHEICEYECAAEFQEALDIAGREGRKLHSWNVHNSPPNEAGEYTTWYSAVWIVEE